MSLGQQLKRLQESKGFSQEDVAKKIGVTRQAVYKWENDKSYPDIDNMLKNGFDRVLKLMCTKKIHF